jgi:hypothetical protein
MLDEAVLALHDLQIGKAVVEVRDQNGETIKYSRARSAELVAYIQELKRQLGLLVETSIPMRLWF